MYFLVVRFKHDKKRYYYLIKDGYGKFLLYTEDFLLIDAIAQDNVEYCEDLVKNHLKGVEPLNCNKHYNYSSED